jgi:hypothetical protein
MLYALLAAAPYPGIQPARRRQPAGWLLKLTLNSYSKLHVFLKNEDSCDDNAIVRKRGVSIGTFRVRH